MDRTQRFHPSGVNHFFCGQDLAFTDYTQVMRAIIAQGRIDLTEENRTQLIDANSPFEWIPSSPRKPRRGILFIHGITDSPYIFSSLIPYFKEKNYHIRSILLPGHGTRPGDLLNTDYSAWIKSAGYGVQGFEHQVDELYIAGFSLGAVLGLQQALVSPLVKGLLFFSPTFKIKTIFVAAAKICHLLQKKWFVKNKDLDFAKYESMCVNTVLQAHQLIQSTRLLKNKNPPKLPLFVAMSENDAISDIPAAIKAFQQYADEKSQCLLYTGKAHAFKDPRIVLRPAAYPEAHVLKISHVAIPLSPHDPHYGIKGDYQVPLTRKNFPQQEIYYAERTLIPARRQNLYRLTFNPDFDYMITAMDVFLNNG